MSQRTKIVKRNIFLSIVIKGCSIFINLLFVPITLNYINQERYGIWLTLSSVVMWFNFFDLGLGNGLRNKLAEAAALDDIDTQKKIISTTYASMVFISLSIATIYCIIKPFIQWDSILGVNIKYKIELNQLAFALVLMFCVQFILQIINAINNAYQMSFLVSLASLGGNIFSLLFILILKYTVPGKLLHLGIAIFSGNLISLFLMTMYFFFIKHKELTPRFSNISYTISRNLLGLGGRFLVIQIAAVVQYESTNILISRYFSPKQVTEYNISYKLFSVLLMAFGILVSPLWSAVTDANAKSDFEWIYSAHKKMLRNWILLVIAAIIILFLSNYLYVLWVGKKIVIPFLTNLGVMFYVMGMTFGMIYVNILNGLGRLKTQYYLSILTMLYFVPLSYFLGVYMKGGVFGITIALVLANINGIIAAPLEFYRIAKNIKLKYEYSMVGPPSGAK